MTAITELGYVRFGVSNLEAWRAFASDLLGLEVCDDPNGGRLFMRLDNWHHRIVLEEEQRFDGWLVALLPAEATTMRPAFLAAL